ncbi:MAG: dockerin type I domain-containing protein [Planctomycetota bacterium]
MSSRSQRKQFRTLKIERLSQRCLLAADVGVTPGSDAEAAEYDQSVIVAEIDPIEDSPPGEETFGEEPRQNPTNRFDVNNDNQISPHDALLVINQLHRQRRPSDRPFVYYHFTDVDGDGSLTPADSLQLINQIARSEPNSFGTADDPDERLEPTQVDQVYAQGINDPI